MSHVFVSFLLTTFQLQKCFLFEKLFDNFFLKIEFSLEVRFFFCGVAVFGVSKGWHWPWITISFFWNYTNHRKWILRTHHQPHRSKVLEKNSGHATAFKHSVHRHCDCWKFCILQPSMKKSSGQNYPVGNKYYIPDSVGEFMKALNLLGIGVELSI